MIAGLLIPGRPVGNMYFAAWSHNVIQNTVNLTNDLKMGEYRMSMLLTCVVLWANMLIYLNSQDTSSRYVPYSNLRYCLGRLCQLCCYDLDCEQQSRSSSQRQWRCFLERRDYTRL